MINLQNVDLYQNDLKFIPHPTLDIYLTELRAV